MDELKPMGRLEALDTMFFFSLAITFATWNHNQEAWKDIDHNNQMLKEILEIEKNILERVERLEAKIDGR